MFARVCARVCGRVFVRICARVRARERVSCASACTAHAVQTDAHLLHRLGCPLGARRLCLRTSLHRLSLRRRAHRQRARVVARRIHIRVALALVIAVVAIERRFCRRARFEHRFARRFLALSALTLGPDLLTGRRDAHRALLRAAAACASLLEPLLLLLLHLLRDAPIFAIRLERLVPIRSERLRDKW